MMSEDLKSAKELYTWNKRALSIGGIWPLKPDFLKFHIFHTYLIVFMIMAIMDLFDVYGELTLTLSNMSETFPQMMLTVKLVVLRYSESLRIVLRQLQNHINKNSYKEREEINIYLAYITTGKIFFKAGSYLALSCALFSYAKPLEYVLFAGSHNETIPTYILPLRMHLFFNITNTRIYALVYLSQLPMVYIYYCHAIFVCFLATLIVHVAGELSVLAHRIRRLTSSDLKDDCNLETALREVITKHYKIVLTATTIDDIFNPILLEELVVSTVLIGLSCYGMLSYSVATSMAQYFYLWTYMLAFVVLIFVYCITGEYLIQESANVLDAYYECNWYEMPLKYRRHLIICIVRAQQPLQLTAGGFYVFSLSQFSDILKTSMAYISMLRTVA